jgi:predicted DsbA family dithiol-disulfide isomerase/uncharacterized membrane protein
MQTQKKWLTKTWSRITLAVLGLLEIGVSLYLVDHYFAISFPKTLQVGTFCNISKFWNCDSAAFSPLSNIYNVPTALFGVAFGLLILVGAGIRDERVTRTNYFLSLMNLLGCIGLLGYSIVFLGGLCPGCTVYYFLSLLTVAIFWLGLRPFPLPNVLVLLNYAVVVALMAGGTYAYNIERFKKQEEVFARWVKKMHREPVYDDKKLDDAMWIIQSTKEFADAPLRITLFSDFQCPFCKLLATELEKIAVHYKGRINIRYMFFPLDNSCNKNVTSAMHPVACDAARLSYCARDQFNAIHDDIYAHQERLDGAWLEQRAKKLGLSACYHDDKTKEAVKALVSEAESFNIDAAPTIFINGRKISGLVPTKALTVLLDAFLADSEPANLVGEK